MKQCLINFPVRMSSFQKASTSACQNIPTNEIYKLTSFSAKQIQCFDKGCVTIAGQRCVCLNGGDYEVLQVRGQRVLGLKVHDLT